MNRRIVFVAPFGLGQKTTIWARTLPMAQFLVRNGDSVTILVPPWDTPTDAGRVTSSENVRIENMSLDGGMLALWRRLLGRAKQLDPDILHIVKPIAYSGLVHWWLWQERRFVRTTRPIILDIDDWEQAWTPINGYSWPVARFLAWQEEWSIRHADGITAASHWLVDRARAVAPTIPRLHLPNGISSQDLPAQPPESPVQGQTDRVLFFSRFVEVPPAWLAEFCKHLLRHRPSCRLSVAGNALQPHAEERFQRSFAAHAGEAALAVDWLGYVQPSELDRLYDTAACAIFPAQNVPLHQAKCSMRLVTTLLHSLPVVASAVGEQVSYGAAGAAHLVNADATPAQFAHEVVRLLAEPARSRQMAASARQRLLTEYDWDRLGDSLSDFYRKIDDNGA